MTFWCTTCGFGFGFGVSTSDGSMTSPNWSRIRGCGASGGSPSRPPQDFARSWIDKCSEGRRDGTCEGFAVVDRDGRFVGLALAPAIDRRARELELGYIVASGVRGRGIATEGLACSPIGHSRRSTQSERF
jgi:RimJ/RimL family protein N-acetyltransferase